MRLLIPYLYATIVLDQIHLACPIVLAWSKPKFRAQILLRWEKFILLPAALLALTVWVGLLTSKEYGWVPLIALKDYRLWWAILDGQHLPNIAFVVLTISYIWWDAWHFGSQHFGVVSLLGWRSAPRRVRQAIIIIPTMAIMLFPWLLYSTVVMMMVLAVMNLAHWLVDIGLTVGRFKHIGMVALIGALLVVGPLGFFFKGVSTNPTLCVNDLACTIQWSVPLLLSLRWGIGFVHFLYSKWVWSSEGRQLLA